MDAYENSYGETEDEIESEDGRETKGRSFLLPVGGFLVVLILLILPFVGGERQRCGIHNHSAGNPIDLAWVPTRYHEVFTDASTMEAKVNELIDPTAHESEIFNPGYIWKTDLKTTETRKTIQEALRAGKKASAKFGRLETISDSPIIADAIAKLSGIASSAKGKSLLDQVEGVTEPIRAWANEMKVEIATARTEVTLARKTPKYAYGSIGREIANLKGRQVNLIERDNRFSQIPSTPDANAVARLTRLQKEYIATLWIDYRMQILETILYDRADLLQKLALDIGRFQTAEIKAIKSPLGSVVENGIEHPMQLRASALLEHAQAFLNVADSESYKKAAALWIYKHVPEGICTCGGDANIPFWTRLSMGEEDRKQMVRKNFNHVFWETLYDENADGDETSSEKVMDQVLALEG